MGSLLPPLYHIQSGHAPQFDEYDVALTLKSFVEGRRILKALIPHRPQDQFGGFALKLLAVLASSSFTLGCLGPVRRLTSNNLSDARGLRAW